MDQPRGVARGLVRLPVTEHAVGETGAEPSKREGLPRARSTRSVWRKIQRGAEGDPVKAATTGRPSLSPDRLARRLRRGTAQSNRASGLPGATMASRGVIVRKSTPADPFLVSSAGRSRAPGSARETVETRPFRPDPSAENLRRASGLEAPVRIPYLGSGTCCGKVPSRRVGPRPSSARSGREVRSA
jgi:hypothetical protein